MKVNEIFAEQVKPAIDHGTDPNGHDTLLQIAFLDRIDAYVLERRAEIQARNAGAAAAFE